MAVRITCVLVVVAAFALPALALDNLDNAGVRVALRVFDECSKSSGGLSPCLKKKAITFLDRVGRLDKIDVTDEISVVRAADEPHNETALNEDEIEKVASRSSEGRDLALSNMLWDKVISLVRSRNIELATPRLSDFEDEDNEEQEEEARGEIDFGGGGGGGNKKGGGGGGGGFGGGGFGGGGGGGKRKGGKGGKGGGMMKHLMMGMMGKMMGLIPLGIAGLFLLAGKALITSKIALLLAGIIAVKKLLANRQSSGHGGWSGGGGGGGGHGGWSSGGGGGGGWDKRSLEESQKLAYSSHAPK